MMIFLKKYPWWALLGAIVCIQVLWPHNPLTNHILKEKAVVEQKSKLMTISYYYPHFNYFADIVTGTQQPKKEWMEGYFFGKPYIFYSYYKKAADLLPEVDAVHFLLGFCQYHRGFTEEAIISYQKTSQLSPFFFWSYYNLGAIYLQQGDWVKSAAMMNQALTANEKITLENLFQNPFYRQILRHVPNAPQVAMAHLKDAQEKAALVLVNSLLKAGAEAPALNIIQSVSPQGRIQELWDKVRKKANRENSTENIDEILKEKVEVELF